ncbi:uncharacterized protein LOC115347664 [Aquila chrysaetos chrysaetos]|uniref:uncharacterized protein LOC115347664 n=1 Tax=Aquila chrysaetos chrysaetos TaxID=223781 RepID=UPI001176A542|nr:uncharacterized protein LOC115347664 [Aquila chrysaetos chrysaetos]
MTQLATMVEKLRKTAAQRRDGGRAGSQNKHDPAAELEPTSGRRSGRCGAGTDADSEQGGRRTTPGKLAVTGGDVSQFARALEGEGGSDAAAASPAARGDARVPRAGWQPDHLQVGRTSKSTCPRASPRQGSIDPSPPRHRPAQPQCRSSTGQHRHHHPLCPLALGGCTALEWENPATSPPCKRTAELAWLTPRLLLPAVWGTLLSVT